MKFKDVYICSKPLQWFNCRNIPISNNDRILIFIGSYVGAEDFFYKLLKNDFFWSDMKFVRSRAESVEMAKKYLINRLIVDCDYGQVGFRYSRIRHNSFVLYEEGVGTYTDLTLRKKFSAIKRRFFSFFGLGPVLGSSSFTDEVYVYNRDYYLEFLRKNYIHINSKKVSTFNRPFFDQIENINSVMENTFGVPFPSTLIKKKRVWLYLLNYNLGEDALNVLNDNSSSIDILIMKFHPNFQGDYEKILSKLDFIKRDNIYLIKERSIMAEYLIFNIMKNEYRETFTLLHQGSTSALYVNPYKVNLIDLPSVFNDFLIDFRASLNNY